MSLKHEALAVVGSLGVAAFGIYAVQQLSPEQAFIAVAKPHIDSAKDKAAKSLELPSPERFTAAQKTVRDFALLETEFETCSEEAKKIYPNHEAACVIVASYDEKLQQYKVRLDQSGVSKIEGRYEEGVFNKGKYDLAMFAGAGGAVGSIMSGGMMGMRGLGAIRRRITAMFPQAKAA